MTNNEHKNPNVSFFGYYYLIAVNETDWFLHTKEIKFNNSNHNLLIFLFFFRSQGVPLDVDLNV